MTGNTTGATTGGWSRRGFLRGGLLAGGLAAAPGVLGGCAAFGFGDTLQKIKSDGVVRAGFAGERPYSYERHGQVVGAIAAVHRAVFDRIGGIEVRGVHTVFSDLIDGLNAGNFDIVAAGMFITADRCDRAIFSEPVYCAKSALLVPRGNPRGLRDFASVARRGASLVVLAGGVEEGYALAVGVPDERIRKVGRQEDGLDLVASGEADAFTLTSISLRALLARSGTGADGPSPPVPGLGPENLTEKVELLDPFTPVIDGEEQLGCGGATFRKPDDTLRAAFNDALGALRREGSLLELMGPYGFTEAELPDRRVTAERLCRTGGVTGKELDPLPR